MKETIVTLIALYFFYRFVVFLFETWNAKAEAKRNYLKNHHY